MKLFVVTAAVLLNMAAPTCTKQATDAVPAPIQRRIEAIKKEPRWNPPAQVEEYRYRGRRVFLFSSNCCDQFNQAFDENGNYLCAPGGGYTGRGDGRCPGFKDSAQRVRLVWKDERE